MNKAGLIRPNPPVPGAAPEPGSRIIEIDLERMSGSFNRLVGVLQEQHGWNRVRAAKEVLRRMTKQRAGQWVANKQVTAGRIPEGTERKT